MSFSNSVSVQAVSDSLLVVTKSKDFYLPDMKDFRLYEDGRFSMFLSSGPIQEKGDEVLIQVPYIGIRFVPGKEYFLATKDNQFFAIDFSYMAYSDAFDVRYRYDGRLGSIYSKEETTFRVFAPFATMVLLHIAKENGPFSFYPMERDDKSGVYSLTLKGDYDKARYTYVVTNFQKTYEVMDPYSFSLDSNARHSFVIDEKKVKNIGTYSEKVKPVKDPYSLIVYECDVRDMTSRTEMKNKGTYDALIRTAQPIRQKSYGIDYIASLGVTHVQLLPTMDFQSVDEDHPSKGYNWGYDPNSYFAPEGSYALDPNDPYSRIYGLRNLVASFHKRGLGVIQDVVYNHLYSTKFNALTLLVPGYYLRKNLDGSLSNGSGCGNDFESRMYMARKLIVDSMEHYLDFYDVDGFRFDLMGILDVETLNFAKMCCDRKKKGLLYYGEGWDLWTAMDAKEKATIQNHPSLPGFGFFNDRFRDVVKGRSGEFDLNVRGYLLGDTSYVEGFKHVFMGSCTPLAFPPLFRNPAQSVNFVECHDNHTLFDKITKACPDDKPDEVYRRIRMVNLAVLLSFGISFLHAGQEFGQSKMGHGNTYNMGDRYNGFDYALLEKHKPMVSYLRDAIRLKKRINQLSAESGKDRTDIVSFENLPQNALHITYSFQSCDIHVLFNPTKETLFYSFQDYVKLIFNESGFVEEKDFFERMAIVNALSCDVFLQKKEVKE